MLLVFVLYQTVYTKHDLFDHRLFSRSRNLPFCLMGMFVEGKHVAA
jgi:hypothetical protein